MIDVCVLLIVTVIMSGMYVFEECYRWTSV